MLNCLSAPTLIDDEACSICGDPVTINILANDVSVSPLDISTISIVNQPSFGTTTITGGQVTYTPNQPGPFVDTFTYTVQDTFGNISQNEGTVTVESICAGQTGTINLCN